MGADHFTVRLLDHAELLGQREEGSRVCVVLAAPPQLVPVDLLAQKQEAIKLIKSADGGKSFGKASVITYEKNPGGPSVVRPGENDNIEGVAGSRTDDFPHVSIANGAPSSGATAPNTIALSWDDGGQEPGDTPVDAHVYLKLSGDGGKNWTTKQPLEEASDRPAMPSAALSPDGTRLYLVYNAFLDPFREHVGAVSATGDARGFEAVVRRWNVSGTSLNSPAELFRGPTGDARASSANALLDEFLGDYNMTSATDTGAVSVYISGQDSEQCQAINTWRDGLVDEAEGEAESPGDAPAPCSGTRFGNTDIRGYVAGR